MKKFRLILGISLIIQSVTFLVLSLTNIEKKKALAKTFGVFSAIGAFAGVSLLYVEYRNRKQLKAMAEEDLYDEFGDDYDDFEDFDIDTVEDDELLCTFEGATTEE